MGWGERWGRSSEPDAASVTKLLVQERGVTAEQTRVIARLEATLASVRHLRLMDRREIESLRKALAALEELTIGGGP